MTKPAEPNGETNAMYCPRCGATNFARLPVAKCTGCTWKVAWFGPLWGTA